MGDVPFSLTCIDCDRGDGIDSPEAAVLQGWADIRPDDGMSWNFLGWCPECAVEQAIANRASAEAYRKSNRKAKR